MFIVLGGFTDAFKTSIDHQIWHKILPVEIPMQRKFKVVIFIFINVLQNAQITSGFKNSLDVTADMLLCISMCRQGIWIFEQFTYVAMLNQGPGHTYWYTYIPGMYLLITKLVLIHASLISNQASPTHFQVMYLWYTAKR